jgi:hypothetical protein
MPRTKYDAVRALSLEFANRSRWRQVIIVDEDLLPLLEAVQASHKLPSVEWCVRAIRRSQPAVVLLSGSHAMPALQSPAGACRNATALPQLDRVRERREGFHVRHEAEQGLDGRLRDVR